MKNRISSFDGWLPGRTGDRSTLQSGAGGAGRPALSYRLKAYPRRRYDPMSLGCDPAAPPMEDLAMSRAQVFGQLIALKGAVLAKAAELGPRPSLEAAKLALRSASQLVSAGQAEAAEPVITRGWEALESA